MVSGGHASLRDSLLPEVRPSAANVRIGTALVLPVTEERNGHAHWWLRLKH